MYKIGLRILSIAIVVLLAACSNNKDQFLIGKNKVGYLSSKTTVGEIESIFKNDSVVSHLSEGVLGYRGSYSSEDDKYLIYSKKGEHLLTITPKDALDSLSTIGFIEVFNKAYVTEKGIGLSSTFEEINLLTRINKVEATFTKATLYLDEFNATMTLDKKDLGLKSYTNTEIQLEQIPGLIKPKTLIVWFD